MSEINPELAVSEVASDKQGAAKLFGSAAPVLRNALGRFFDKRPGALDEHNLRLIAASAPDVKDPKLVAELIDGLAITGMQISMRPVEIETARPMFERSISSYPPKTRQALVADLVRQNTLGVLLFAPPESLTPGARAVVEDHLLELAAGDQASQATAVRSPYVTRPVIDKVLAKIEERIERSERGTDRREPTKMPLEVVADGLAQILHRDTLNTTTEDVTRAWQLVKRCNPGPDGQFLASVLSSATSNPKLDEPTARSVLDTIEDYRYVNPISHPGVTDWRRQVWRAAMLCVPETPEAVARIAATRETMLNFDEQGDHRTYALRKHYYGRFRLKPLQTFTSDQLDRKMLEVPSDLLTAGVVAQIENPDVLRRLSGHSRRFVPRVLRALIDNPNTPSDTTFDVDPWNGTSVLDRMMSTKIREELLQDPRNDDERLVELLRQAKDDDERDQLLINCVQHPSAGDAVIDEVLRRAGAGSNLLAILAGNSSRPEVHRRLLAIARQSASVVIDDTTPEDVSATVSAASKIIDHLACNPTVGVEILGEAEPMDLADCPNWGFESLHYRPIRSVFGRNVQRRGEVWFAPKHDPRAVARAAVDGRVPADRIDAIVDQAAKAHGNVDGNPMVEAALLLADTGRLTSEHWAELTRNQDLHYAIRFATHTRCRWATSSLNQQSLDALSSTAEALEVGAPAPERRPRSWNDLPNTSDVPFPASPAVDLIDGQTVEGKKLAAVRTPRELTRIAKHMGNCLEGFTDGVRQGTYIIAVAEEPDDTTAVAWRVLGYDTHPTIEVQEINTRFNAGNASQGFRAGIDAMTVEIRNGTLQPVAKTGDEPNTTREPNAGNNEPSTRPRPRPRRRLDLASDAGQDSDGRGHEDARQLDDAQPPSLLTPIPGPDDPDVGIVIRTNRAELADDQSQTSTDTAPEVGL